MPISVTPKVHAVFYNIAEFVEKHPSASAYANFLPSLATFRNNQATCNIQAHKIPFLSELFALKLYTDLNNIKISRKPFNQREIRIHSLLCKKLL